MVDRAKIEFKIGRCGVRDIEDNKLKAVYRSKRRGVHTGEVFAQFLNSSAKADSVVHESNNFFLSCWEIKIPKRFFRTNQDFLLKKLRELLACYTENLYLRSSLLCNTIAQMFRSTCSFIKIRILLR